MRLKSRPIFFRQYFKETALKLNMHKLQMPFIFLIIVTTILAHTPTAIAQNIFVKILVNDRPITNFDINARAKLLRLSRVSKAQAQKKAAEELINEELQLAEAQRLRITVNESEVEKAFAAIAQRTKMKPAQFERALRSVGVNPKTLKHRLRASLAWRQVVIRRFRATIRIQEQDVVAAMLKKNETASDKKIINEYTLQQVIFVYPKNAKTSTKEQRRREAEALRSRFTSCKNSIEIAQKLRDVAIKNLGRKASNELPPALKQSLEETPTGKLTRPRMTEQGIEMLAVCDKKQIQSIAGKRTEVENELRGEEAELLARRYIRDLRSAAIIVRK